MAQSQFLLDFQNSMTKLNEMNQKVQGTIAEKNRLQERLQKVNQMIQQLAGDINTLKAKVDGLQKTVNTNSSSIGDKDKQIADLTQRMNALEAEKQQLTQNLTDFQKQSNEEKSALQQKIDADEAQIRKLTQDNEIINQKSAALAVELASKGDLPAQHAEELKKQTEEFQQQLAKQQQDNQGQIDQLMAQIKDRDAKIADLHQQLQAKVDEAESHIKNIAETLSQGQSQIEQLNQQIVDLKAENEDLVQRIIAATQAIVLASENLKLLAETAPNAQSEKEVDNLFDEIKNSLQTISNAIQGGQTQSQMYSDKNKTKINVIDDSGKPRTIELQILASVLGQSLNEAKNNGNSAAIQKIESALAVFRDNKANPQAISEFLNNNGFKFYNGSNKVLVGGKKRTKKLRKQKGGFTYKLNSKRRIVPTSSRGSITKSSRCGRGRSRCSKSSKN